MSGEKQESYEMKNIRGLKEKMTTAMDAVNDLESTVEDFEESLDDIRGRIRRIHNEEAGAVYSHFTDLKLGQHVYGIEGRSKEVDCETCNGTGFLKAIIDDQNTRTIECPDCKRGRTVTKKYSVAERTVAGIELTFNIDGTHIVHFRLNRGGYNPGGTMTYKRSEIYTSREDAKKAVEEKEAKS